MDVNKDLIKKYVKNAYTLRLFDQNTSLVDKSFISYKPGDYYVRT